MENEIYTFKEKIIELVNKEEQKVWLAEKHGKRIEYLFKVGREQFGPPNKIAETDQYVLFGQNIENLKPELKEMFNKYI